MIDVKRKRTKKALTLAEVMITMLVISLVTLCSVPIIKKSGVLKDAGVDRHSWAAYYKGDQLMVCNDGSCSPASGTEVNFTPPDGVSRMTVTVIGGGGGGAAGTSSQSFSKKFWAESNLTNNIFSVPSTGLYQIVAIGAGGGGAGGYGSFRGKCTGNDGDTGTGYVATAKLTAGEDYGVIVGVGGYGGNNQTFGENLIEQGLIPVLSSLWDLVTFGGIISKVINYSILATLGPSASSGGFLMDEILLGGSSAAENGGGHGLNTVITGNNLNISAGGGIGGHFKYKKHMFGHCYKKSRDAKFDIVPTVECTGSALVGSCTAVSKADGPYFCRNKNNALLPRCNAINTAMEGGYQIGMTYGDAGRGSVHGHGRSGSPGYAEITEISAYGGGGGQAGSVSVYQYDHSPLDTAAGEKSIRVTVGKGGDGGSKSASLDSGKNGKDGKFSRFGTKIIAAGGEGGKIKKIGAEMSTSTLYKSKGEDGLTVVLPTNTFEKAGIVGCKNKFAGKQADAGEGRNNLSSGQCSVPGIGGAGGGSYVYTNTGNNDSYNGGSGSSGLVLVTW